MLCASPLVCPAQNFVNFEGKQVSPVRVSPDGTRLFAVNTPDARLSVFDISNPNNPILIAEIPVGIEPVSVNPRSSDEAWVVNEVSDSISIVSVSRRIVVDTIYVQDEPGDVVFAGGKAFVTRGRRNDVRVFDVVTHLPVGAPILLVGENPRAITVNSNETRIYVAMALSGNRTTIIPPGSRAATAAAHESEFAAATAGQPDRGRDEPDMDERPECRDSLHDARQ